MTSRIFAALGVLALGFALAAPWRAAWAQQSLVDLVRAGKRELVLAELESPRADVDARAPDGSTALHWATYAADRELVAALLAAGATADVTSRYGATPLAEAVKLADVELVRMLLDAGADPDSPNADNQTALMLAASLGSLEVAKLLIERGADVNAVETFRGQNALMWAAGNDHPDVVDLLLAHGAADLDRRALHDDWPRQMTSEPRAQFRHTGGLTALIYATRSGCYRCVVSLVEAGADVDRPNPDGITPLLNAVDTQNFEIAMYLLDHGARPDVWDMYGRTPLYTAIDMHAFGGGRASAAIGALDVARRLIAMGVDVNHELTRMRPNGPGRGRFADYMMRGGTGPLMVATLGNDHESIELLLANGAEVDLPNVFQITPLMAAAGMSGTVRNSVGGSGNSGVFAARGGGPAAGRGGGAFGDPAIRTIDLLLDAGADINARVLDSHTKTAFQDSYIPGADNEGKTALHAAVLSGRVRVVEHLLARGADPTIADAYGKTPLDLAEEGAGAGPPAAAGGRGAGPGGAPGRSIADVLRAALRERASH